ncbi:MAG: 1-deoxy-D-xylulose-5-phosphate synthase [Ruminococcus sp.]|jgi:1-deoxy-D-xylulose-5-phosphate synthase|nr:1-deoxy-D-xylulose-5-phosphate synthase [Ruminococcus sp.]
MNIINKLKKMNLFQVKQFCRKIRKEIIAACKKNGGHLAPNLGTVELTAALYRVFDFPHDKLVWDVGHQSYAAKIITGEDLQSLRVEDGVSGFCRPDESEFTPVVTGHSSNSVSAALGLAEAMAIKGDNHAAVAVLGDGAFTGGLCFEGLNNAGKSGMNMIVILNQNDMSIGKNVGAVAKYLSTIRISDNYLRLKQRVKQKLATLPVIGEPIAAAMLKTKDVLKNALYYSSTMFEQLGFAYVGPIDGHNIRALEEALTAAKSIAGGKVLDPRRPVLVHINTIKGKGYKPAEKNPGAYHSIPVSYNENSPPTVSADSFSSVIGSELLKLAKRNKKIVAITAAMKYAVGLAEFSNKFPKRFFDVGIAEAHAVTFSGGLAAGGLTPVFCVYSSFLQRAYDQIIHDLAIANLHAVICVDRAGFVGEDGETHQGLFDIPFLTTIPGVKVLAPSSFAEARAMLNEAVKADGIVALRYPKGNSNSDCDYSGEPYKLISNKNKFLAIGYGRQFCEMVNAEAFDLLKLNQIFPIVLPDDITDYEGIEVFEESMESGGIGEHIAAKLLSKGFSGKFGITAVTGFVPQASVQSQLSRYNLDSDGVNRVMEKYYKKPTRVVEVSLTAVHANKPKHKKKK